MVYCIFWGSQVIIFKNNVFLSLKIDLVLANSADPDEMPHYAAFHLGLHYLPKYPSSWPKLAYAFFVHNSLIRSYLQAGLTLRLAVVAICCK